jgi:hypothetical protein
MHSANLLPSVAQKKESEKLPRLIDIFGVEPATKAHQLCHRRIASSEHLPSKG